MPDTPQYPLVHSMKTGVDYDHLLNDSQGGFQKFSKDFIKNHAETMGKLAELRYEKDQHIALEDLQAMGSGNYNLWLKITVPDSKGKPLELDSAEFIAWQKEAKDKAPDQWAAERGVDIISEKYSLQAGEQTINIEQDAGRRRAVTYKGVVSEPREGYYGEVEIKDSHGKPVYNGDGLPDIFLSEAAMQEVKSGQPYHGRVVVMDQQDKGKFDEVKFYFGGTEGKNDAELKADFSRVQASAFTKKEEFHKKAEGQYTTMSHAQYQAWTYDVAAHPEHSEIAFTEWTKQQWGSKERFDKILGGMETISKEDYHTLNLIANGRDGKAGTKDDLSAEETLQKHNEFNIFNLPNDVRKTLFSEDKITQISSDLSIVEKDLSETSKNLNNATTSSKNTLQSLDKTIDAADRTTELYQKIDTQLAELSAKYESEYQNTHAHAAHKGRGQISK